MSRLFCASLAALFIVAPALADKATTSPVKETAKDVGHAVGTAAREVGHGSKKVAKDVGKAVTEAARETGHAFRDGAQEFKKAVHGESKPSDTSAKEAVDKKKDK